MDLTYYEQLCGDRRVNMRLSTLMYLDDLLKQEDIHEARQIVRTACAADKRKELRELREQVWRLLQAARADGKNDEADMWRQRLRDVEELQKLFSV